jgi:hypothetical protein
MQIAKPPGGFSIVEPDGVKALIRTHQARWPRLETYWADIKARLKQTGHREGTPTQKGPRGARVFIAEGDDASGLPRVTVAYIVLGDALDIRLVEVGPARKIL